MKPSDIEEAIIACHDANAAIMIHGAPGVGKTSIVRAAVERMNTSLAEGDEPIQLVTLRVNLLEPVDFSGLPAPDGERVKWLLPDWTPSESTRGVIFLDELPQAPIATQCAAMKLVDSLPSTWQIIAAGNRVADRAGAGQVATHVLSRFTHIEMDVDRENWQKWAGVHGIRPEVRAFIDFRPSLLFSFDAAQVQKERANCSPRSWERVSKLLATVPQSILLEMLTGTVGAGASAEFQGFLRICQECPTADEIIKNADKISVPKEPSAIFAVCASLADRARTLEKEKMPRVIMFMARLPVEFGALLITDLINVAKDVLAIPEAGKWISTHKDIFAHRVAGKK